MHVTEKGIVPLEMSIFANNIVYVARIYGSFNSKWTKHYCGLATNLKTLICVLSVPDIVKHMLTHHRAIPTDGILECHHLIDLSRLGAVFDWLEMKEIGHWLIM